MIEHLIMFLVGVLAYVLLKRYFKIELKHKYSWECPAEGCEFKVSANYDPGIIVTVAERHERFHQYTKE